MKKGFTLIELLIVIAIIGILAVAFLPSLLGAPSKGRDTTRVEQITKIQTFLVSRALTNPASLPANSCIDSALAADISALIKANLPDFGGVFPADPQPNTAAIATAIDCDGKYGYFKFAGGKGYTAGVYAVVENPEKANILCENVKSDTAPTLTPGAVVGIDPTANKYGCYLSLIQ